MNSIFRADNNSTFQWRYNSDNAFIIQKLKPLLSLIENLRSHDRDAQDSRRVSFAQSIKKRPITC